MPELRRKMHQHLIDAARSSRTAFEIFLRIDGTQRAGALAHYAFFSLFPAFILLVAVASVFIERERATREIITFAERYIPLGAERKDFIFDTLAGVIGSRGPASLVATLFLCWAVMRFFATIIRATNRAWGMEVHTWWRLRVKSLLFLAAMVAATPFVIATPLLLRAAKSWLTPHADFAAWIYAAGGVIIPAALLFLALALFYKLAPRRRTRFAEVWIPALVATVSIVGASKLFGFYLKHFATLNAVYGTFGGIMALLMWIYLSGCIFVFGACLCAANGASRDEAGGDEGISVRSTARRRATGGVLMIVAVAVTACGRAPGPQDAAETAQLLCDPARLSLPAGASGKLAARAHDAAGKSIDGASISFSAADPRLLRVTAQGEVTSLGPAGLTSVLITSGAQRLTVPVDVSAGPEHRFRPVGADARTVTAGIRSKDPVEVQLLDAFGNPVANSGVRFEAAIEPSAGLSTATDANGMAAFNLPEITLAGPFVLKVHALGTPRISLVRNIQVNAATPAELEAVKVPASGPVALFPEFELVLRVRDAFGNPVPNVKVGWRADSGSAKFDPQQSLSGPDGLVSTRWHLTGLKRRGTTLRASVVDNEKIGFKRWIALER